MQVYPALYLLCVMNCSFPSTLSNTEEMRSCTISRRVSLPLAMHSMNEDYLLLEIRPNRKATIAAKDPESDNGSMQYQVNVEKYQVSEAVLLFRMKAYVMLNDCHEDTEGMQCEFECSRTSNSSLYHSLPLRARACRRSDAP